MDTKICAKCEEEKELTHDNFAYDKKARDGYMGTCKVCRNKRVVELRKEHWDEYKSKKSEYCEKNRTKITNQQADYVNRNKDQVIKWRHQYKLENKVKTAAYQRDNSEHIAAYLKVYRQINKDELTEKRKLYVDNHREQVRLNNQKRKAIGKQLSSTLTVEQWENVKLHFNNQCAYCGKSEKLTMDHFVPVSRQGELSKDNVVPVCASCNSYKHTSNFFNWYPKQPFYSKKRERSILRYLNYKQDIQQLQLYIREN